MRRHRKAISLNGRWKFKTDADGQGDFEEPNATTESWQRTVRFFDPEYDDSGWDEITVPACWQAEGYRYNGIAWYRTRFDHQPDERNNVARLSFSGVDYFADVWLNGYYLGSHEGFFNHFALDASKWIRQGKNLLVVKVEAPDPPGSNRVLIKGALKGRSWDCNDPEVDPGGIYNDVRLLLSRDVYVDRIKATAHVDLEKMTGRVHCKSRICNATDIVKTVDLRIVISPDNFSGKTSSVTISHLIVPGMSEIDSWIDVEDPKLWWPWDMGEQNLYRISVAVKEGPQVLDEIADRIGLRDLRKKEGTWESYINGKRIFGRGPNYLSDQLQSNMTREKYDVDVQLMKDANMNMVRVYIVVEKEEFYDACDEKGVLVYQDFPVAGRMSNTGDLIRRAVPQARDMVNQLYNHPSIVIWCWGAQPGIKNFEKLGMALARTSKEEDPYRFIQQGSSVWEWRRAKEKYNWPIDYHLLAGWFHSDDRFGPFLLLDRSECNSGDSVEELKIKDKRLLEFVSEYGPPEALPEMDSLEKIIPENDRWPVNWKVYQHHRLHGDILRRWIGEPKSLEQLISDSQDYQAFHLKYHTEFYRRHKFAPCNGALFFQFRDCWPAVTAAIVDYYGKKKKAYFTLQKAFAPLHVMIDWPAIDGEEAGTGFSKKIFVVNDYLHEYPSLEVRWRILDSRGETLQSGTIPCTVPENSLCEVGEVSWQIPDETNEHFAIDVELRRGDEALSSNNYELTVRGKR